VLPGHRWECDLLPFRLHHSYFECV
jgi:hypothetical protein